MIRASLRSLVVSLVAVTAVAVVSGCKAKQSQSDVDSSALGAGMDGGVDSTALSFDPQGSDSGRIEGLVTVQFGYDRSSLDNSAREKLRGNAQWMKNNSNVRVQIEGHCDARGSIEYNIALGERRANAVKSFLVSQGVSADRLSVISYGKEKPVATGDSEAAYAQNRRANFVPVQ
ncbi:MAG TPA: peptidoglycan-associated lipoprotein Pal [Pseudobdellovibrionaceae bacterium]|nr:peptidoglycan-associated lipoprotein Pal [Pseudobdellovibrionaceae bacterium]